MFFANEHYQNHEPNLFASPMPCARIPGRAATGIVLQIVPPMLAMAATPNAGRILSSTNSAAWPQLNKVAAIDTRSPPSARAAAPASVLGNLRGPHMRRAARRHHRLRLEARTAASPLKRTNPHHAHEWTLFETRIGPPARCSFRVTNFAKSNSSRHPEPRRPALARKPGMVGAENVMTADDRGYGPGVGQAAVGFRRAFAKLAALAERVRVLPSREFGSRRGGANP